MKARALLLALVLTLTAGPTQAKWFDIVDGENVDFDVSTLRGLRLRVHQPRFELRLGGRLHVDLASGRDDRTPIERFDWEVRRGRLFLRGKLFEEYAFKIEREFGSSRRGWRNLWIRYKPNRSISLKVGNFVSPLGLQDISSSNHATLMERSTSSGLASGYQSGLRLDVNGQLGRRKSRNRWTLSLAGLTEPLGQSSDDAHRSEHWGLGGRATFAPLARKRKVLHVGIAVEYRDLLNDSGYQISSRPESGLAPALLNTGTLSNVDSVVTVGVEAAGLLGPFLLQGEYMRSFLQRGNGNADVGFHGGYVQASYVLTGERRRYSRARAVFGGLKPRHDWGAVEIAARFSALDLDDGTVRGGQSENLTLGLNWYLRQNLRFMFNYVRVDAKRRGGAPRSDDPQIFEVRFQLFF